MAVGNAQRALLADRRPIVREARVFWHAVRLWCRSEGGEPLCRSHRDAGPAVPSPADAVGETVEVVGRRQLRREVRNALRTNHGAGVVLYGPALVGKTALAADMARRLVSHDTVTVTGSFGAADIISALRSGLDPVRGAILDEGSRAASRGTIDEFRSLLMRVVDGGPGDGVGARPIVLLLDGVERVLVAEPTAVHRLDDEHQAVFEVLAEVFAAVPDSCLLMTSRYAFTLPPGGAIELVRVSTLAELGRDDLAARHRRRSSTEVAERSGLASIAQRICADNPGLHNYVGSLVYSAADSFENAATTLAAVDDYFTCGAHPTEPELAATIDRLNIDPLLDSLGVGDFRLLRMMSAFTAPVPVAVVAGLSTHVGGSAERLLWRGLVDEVEPSVGQPDRRLRGSPLVLGRLTPLETTEHTEFARAAVPLLIEATKPESDSTADVVQIVRLALQTGRPIRPLRDRGAHHARSGADRDHSPRLPNGGANSDRRDDPPRSAERGEEPLSSRDGGDGPAGLGGRCPDRRYTRFRGDGCAGGEDFFPGREGGGSVGPPGRVRLSHCAARWGAGRHARDFSTGRHGRRAGREGR